MRRAPMTIILTLLVLFRMDVSAQDGQEVSLSYYLPASASYDPAVPTPEAFFGFQVGTWHLQPDQIHAYLKELARVSDRISVHEMGRTYEDREIMLAVITSPSNHKDLDRIRQEHLALSDPSRSGAVSLENMPVFVWMGYSVHGNEASGSNAAVLVAYCLAASRDEEITSALEKSVILFNPSINPDGLNRFAGWVNANKGMAVDPSPLSREHDEPWPGGRTNHYWFDLNRDWMPLQHPESRARIREYYRWRPNILTDHHEMSSSSTFFFQPGIPGRDNPLTPPTVSRLTARIGEYHARALDSIGSLYYSEESFDDFYIGKGSSYPDITGGIGILFEQASSRGHAQKTDGGVLTFPFAIRNQVTTSFSTLRAAVAMRTDLLAHQRDMAKSALDLADRSRVAAYVFGSGSDRSRTRALASILDGHTIDVYELAGDVRVGNTTFKAGEAFVVPVGQVQSRLVTSLFERRTEFQDSLFYDVSAWSLPMTSGLPSGEMRSLEKSRLGRRFDPSGDREAIALPEEAMLYVFPWSDFMSPRALERLFDHRIVPRMAFEPFTALTLSGPMDFERGTVIVAVGAQSVEAGTVRRVLNEIAEKDGIPVFGLTSGQTQKGIDLGSPNVRIIDRPRIALLAGPGVSSTDAGEVWHLLDNRYDITVTLLDPRSVRRTVLKDFSVMIMPAGAYSDIDSQRTADLKEWVQEGNTLIAVEQAVSWVVRNKIANVKLKEAAQADRDSSVVIRYDQESDVWGARRVPGAIVSASADRTHPLLFGWGEADVYLFKSTSIAFEASPRRSMIPVLYGNDPLVSGYLHQRSIDHLRNAGAIAAVATGRGRVILLADSYTFRAVWFGTSRILTNAVFLGPHLQVPSSEE